MTSDGGGGSRLRIGSWLPEPAIRPARSVTVAPPAAPDPVDVEVEDDDGNATPAPPDHRREGGGGHRRLWVAAGGLVLCAAIAATVATCSAPSGNRGIAGQEAVIAPGSEPATVEESADGGEAHLDRRASPTPSRASTRPAFQPIGLEAETASAELGGPAEIVAYAGASGGRIVQNLGRQGPGAKRNGTLTFADVAVPSDGTYTLTLYLVNSGTGGSGTAVVTVAGGGSVSVTATGGADCCVRTAVAINLKKGPNSVTFGNPDGRAPSLDRIVISAP
ncbi:carbohydrate-binding protein [Dactylosporangium darangshiense]|uniref:hypothetical protein n=1 Tax=Dactylosporangium darangshiense TaxID=579108 RepID=UPI0031EEDC6C